ncbi:wolframin isoform X2 [Cimex lectularius]|uniref:Wolframin n=1 Tax=Cimex lectularius TaxID=79782 RepID=A0A8I6TBX6_CIMLE|nr:wolframin isoform X2 [Cimex lectularius]
MSGDRKNNPEGRKKWNRFNSTTPVQVFNGCLAEDGCPDSQAILGKQLLEGKLEDSVDQEQNDRLGVYWLVKASEQGHKEATKILETCLKTGKGITKHNIGDVTNCLNMSQEEKISRHAARVLFTSLSQGTDYITSEQLSEAMERAQKDGGKDREKKSVQKAASYSSIDYKDCLPNSILPPCEKLSEDVLVSAASHHSRGKLPIVHRVLALKKSNSRSNRTFLQNSIFTPITSIHSSYQHFIHSIGKRPISSFFPNNTTCIQTLVILALYSIGFDSIFEALPSLFYFSSLAIMLITTCQILTKRWEFNEFRQWSNLLVTWGGQEVNAEGAEMSHCYNNIYPCYAFLLALVANIALSQFVSVMIIPYSELVVLSTICAFVTLYNFAWQDGKFDFLALLSFGISALARQNPYDSEAVLSQSLTFLNLFMPTFVTTILRDFNFSILMYVLMFILLWRMAVRDQRKGIYKSFLPHLISLSWWQMAIIASNGATTFGLLRSSLVVVIAVLILPLAGLAILLLPIVAIVKFFIIADEALFASTTFAAACLCNFALIYFGTRPSRTGRFIGKLQVGLGVLSAVLLIFSTFANSPIDEYNSSAHLSWQQYQHICSKDTSPVQVPAQIRCASLSGLQVHWEGLVKKTVITNTYNPLGNFVSKLPNWIQNVVTCMYGQKYSSECDDVDNCHIPYELHSRCHLSNWNRYEYEIEAELVSSNSWNMRESRVVIKAGNMFTNFTQGLAQGDKIWFSGLIDFDPKSEVPRLNLYQIGCLDCSKLLNPYVAEYPQFNVYTLFHIFIHFVEFIFNPNFSF